ncbi:MAG: hypothetical protein Kow0077_16370 [Anaerolineae bacterium]
MLANPGFEGFYRSYGSGSDLVLEFRIADGWHPWYRQQTPEDPEWRYRRPEYRPASYSFNGTAAQQFFTSFSTHEAGLWQRVSGVVPGQRYRFSLAVYIWSSNGGDFYHSEQPGGARVRIGIDPSGGTNPYASSVIWSPFASFYDQWRVLTVEATARSQAATVFVWSSQDYPVVHNDVAVDEAYFGPAGAAPASGLTSQAEEAGSTPQPDVQAQAPPILAVPASSDVTVTLETNVRLRGRIYGPVLAVIPAGETVPVLGRSADRNWALVSYGGQQGWIGSWLGRYSQPFDSIPVVDAP